MSKKYKASDVKYNLEDFERTLTLIIGTGKKQKTVKASPSLLSAQSVFFKKACDESWLESDKVIRFPTEDPQMFEIFLVWVNGGDIKYAASLVKVEKSDEPDSSPHITQHYRRWIQLLHCYLLADFLQAPVYMNAIMDALIDALQEFENDKINTDRWLPLCDSCTETIDFVWEETVVKSRLRKLVIDTLMVTRFATWYRTQAHYFDQSLPPIGPKLNVSHEFILQFMEAQAHALRSNSVPQAPWSQRYLYYFRT